MNAILFASDDFVGVIEPDSVQLLLRVGGEALLQQVVELFLNDAPQRLETARAAAAAGDIEGVRGALHALKASAGQLGALAMAERCRQGEWLALQGAAPALPAAVADVVAAFEVARPRFMDLCEVEEA